MPTEKFAWRNGARIKVSPEKAHEVFQRIYKRDGRITPEAVVATSRSKNAVLHTAFDWDDCRAAEQHRLSQARMLMRSLVLVYSREEGAKPIECRAVVKILPGSDLEDDPATEPKSYLPIKVLMQDEDRKQALLAQAKRELLSWGRRYAHLKEFLLVHSAIDQLLTEPEPEPEPASEPSA